ncbi:MAG: STAS domain-containing protein [Prevotella sp.]|nr:STAS domain-containing protein [Prevotella sp.]MDD5896109.1 STAS domain-containing protein [Prevotellaceae bacterium]
MAEIVRNENKILVKTGVRIDTINAGEFEREINPILAEQGVDVEFDCSELDYISSSGLRVVLKAQKMISANKGQLKLTGVKPQIKKVFDMTGFSRFLKIN